MLPDLSALDRMFDVPLVFPAALALALMLLAQTTASLRLMREQPFFPLLTAVRWAWPVALLAGLVYRYPALIDRLGLVPPESPRGLLGAAGASLTLFVTTAVAWWWVRPRVGGPSMPFAPETGVPGYARVLLFGGEAFAHQAAFALVRAPARGAPAAWLLCIVVGALLILVPALAARWARRPLPRHTVLALIGLGGGTGLVLSGQSLWAAIAWEWAFLVATPPTGEASA